MKIKCKIKKVKGDCSEILLYPQEKFDPIDICGENCTLEVQCCNDGLFPI